MPKGFRRSLILAMLAVVAGFAVLGLLSRHITPVVGNREPPIPIYPQAYQVKDFAAPERGWHQIVYRVEEDYPSERVLHYYTRELAELGYRLMAPNETPAWQPEKAKKESRRMKLRQVWIDPRRLRILELQLVAVETFQWNPEKELIISRELQPGQEVIVTLSRKVIVPGEEETSPQG